MDKKHNFFISWSSPKSKQIARALNEHMPLFIQKVEPFFSDEDIMAGGEWFHSIVNAMSQVRAGFIVLTKQNANKPWLLFEAGALVRTGNATLLCCDFPKEDLAEYNPLFSHIQAVTLSDKNDFFKAVKSLNNSLDNPVKENILQRSFDAHWPTLTEAIQLGLAELNKEEAAKFSFERIAGTYDCRYRQIDGGGGKEVCTINGDGSYLLHHHGKMEHYFQLRVLDFVDNVVSWEKVQMENGRMTDSVHSVEKLRLNGDGALDGSDSTGHIIRYEKKENR